jgi:hypothetical protein
MEKQESYEQLIIRGLKGLPQELLAEIADFVYFVRQRAARPEVFEQERQQALSEAGTSQAANEAWLKLAGTISQDDLKLMAQAIEEGCEQVDLNEW